MSKTTKKWIFLGALTIFVVLSVLAIIREDRWFNSLPASEHLTIAKELLATNHVEEASRHLRAIPATAPESEEAVKLLVDARLQEVQRQAQEEKERGSPVASYWPTTVRVQTDMNSFWLDQEERVCVGYPDGHGTVAVVHCGSSERPESHNIPVTFCGSVDRGKSSEWKCRREAEKFVAVRSTSFRLACGREGV